MPLACDVLLPLPVPPFRYLVPFDGEPGPVGGRVVVPWQGTYRIGLCVAVYRARADDSLNLRETVGWLDSEPFVLDSGVELLRRLTEATSAPAGVVLASLLATGLRARYRHEVRRMGEGHDWEDVASLDEHELEAQRAQGMIRERAFPAQRTLTHLVATSDDPAAASGKQRLALEELLKGPVESAAQVAAAAGVSASTVRALITKGLAAYREVPAGRVLPGLPAAGERLEVPGLQLPDGDFDLVGGLRFHRLAALLPLLEADLAAGRSPMVLAPEVGWLEEAVSRLANHVPVLMLSGEAKDAEREGFWQAVAEGSPAVITGTYAALLAPVPRPGRLILLEACSPSWKQPAGARLHVPDAAIELARLRELTVVTADAVESPEMRARGAELIRLPAPAQRLHVTDLNGARGWPLDTDLVRVLKQVATRERQGVLLSSRRGFSGALTCKECSSQVECPHCDLPLRYHQADGRLRCHQCGFERTVPPNCPVCTSNSLAPARAAGTQWLAQAVQRLLPDFPVLRLDGDTKDDLGSLYRGEPGLLVATTAVFRRPPLPRADLLAVALFDAHTSMSDFRASETTLRLLRQLPELSLNPRPLTLIQTFQPQHRVLRALLADDQALGETEFVTETCERREAFGYPPYTRMARVELSARDRASVAQAASHVAGSLRELGAQEFELIGPTPAPVARLKGRFLYHLLLRAADPARLRELLGHVPRGSHGARILVDVDPRDVSVLEG